MPRLFTGLDAARIRANLERIRSEIADAGRDPAEVDILAAVKYVPLEEIGTLAEAGLTLLGENRAQELEEKASRFPDFRWHFIGQLQSRKVKSILPHATLIHSVASESALRQLADARHAGDRDPARGQRRGRGGQGRHRARRAPAVPRAGRGQGRGTDDDAAVRRGSGGSRARTSRRLRELAQAHGLEHLSMGTSQDFAVAAAEGATIVRIGTSLYT